MSTKQFDEYECECIKCQALCMLIPCMGTPQEVQAIIDSGYAYPNKLIVSETNDPVYDFIAVKPRGANGDKGKCIFFDLGKCMLHRRGLKPLEGRVAMHGVNSPRRMYAKIAKSWKTKKGRELVARIKLENKMAKANQ